VAATSTAATGNSVQRQRTGASSGILMRTNKDPQRTRGAFPSREFANQSGAVLWTRRL
jgi:hypothetical protein